MRIVGGAVLCAGGLAAFAAPAAREERWSLLFEAVRREHPLWEGTGRFEPRDRTSLEGLALPTLLPAETWGRIMGRSVAPGRVAAAILGERGAAFLYRGLFQLDPETLAFVASRDDLLRSLHDGPADVFAAFAGSLRIRAGRVDTPGGDAAAPLWEELVGEAVDRPERFVPRLLSEDGGAVAALFDAVARLDPPRQRFALRLNDANALRRHEGLRALRRAFDAEPRWWRPSLGAYRRPPVDPARVLATIGVDDGGRPAPPRGRGFWEDVFGVARSGPARAERDVDAPWLVEAVGRAAPAARRERLTEILFAQRVFGSASEASRAAVVAGLRGLAARPALVLVLDRMGVRDPVVYARALDAADRLSAVGDRAGRAEAGTELEATLALLDRSRSWARTLDEPVTATLLRSLFAVVPGPRGYSGSLGRWWDVTLVPALRRATHAADAAPRELVLLHALSGLRFDEGARPTLVWEGRAYRSDPGGAELQRLLEVRRRQGGPTLDEALDPRPGPLPSRGAPRLAEVLASLAYAPHLGPPDGPALAGSNVALRHDFAEAPWRLPEQIVRPGVPWHVEGSLLALDVALAPLASKRVGAEMPSQPPGLDGRALLPFTLAVELMSPYVVEDRDVATVAAALRAGRDRARRIATSADVDGAARDAGLEPWRREGLRWAAANEPEALDRFFTLEELFGLGRNGAAVAAEWGTCDLARGGTLRLVAPEPRPLADDAGRPPEDLLASRLPDLSLRVAADLAQRSLPASLAPSLLARLVRDFGDAASPLEYDDRVALARLPRDLAESRADDLVASLCDGGPLRPAPTREARTP